MQRTEDHYCGRRSHKVKSEYLDCFADAIECHGPGRQLDYRKVSTSELQEFCAEEGLCQGKFPLNAILPPLRAARGISIDEYGLCFHELEQVRATNSPRRDGRRTFFGMMYVIRHCWNRLTRGSGN